MEVDGKLTVDGDLSVEGDLVATDELHVDSCTILAGVGQDVLAPDDCVGGLEVVLNSTTQAGVLRIPAAGAGTGIGPKWVVCEGLSLADPTVLPNPLTVAEVDGNRGLLAVSNLEVGSVADNYTLASAKGVAGDVLVASGTGSTTSWQAPTALEGLVKKTGDTMSGTLDVKNTTESTSEVTGSIITAGGLGVAKNIHVGGDVKVALGKKVQADEHVFAAETDSGIAWSDPTAWFIQHHGQGVVLFNSADGVTGEMKISPSAPGYKLNVADTTDAVSVATGAITTAGGLGVAKAIHATAEYLGGGSAGAPSISFSNNTNMGMYRPAADAIGFSTIGVNRVTIDVNGITSGMLTLQQQPFISRYHSASISVPSGANTIMKWNQQMPNQVAVAGITLPGPHERFTVTHTGTYHLNCDIRFPSSGSPYLARVLLFINSVEISTKEFQAGNLSTHYSIASTMRLSAGNYVEIFVYQNSGVAQAVGNNFNDYRYSNRISMVRLH